MNNKQILIISITGILIGFGAAYLVKNASEAHHQNKKTHAKHNKHQTQVYKHSSKSDPHIRAILDNYFDIQEALSNDAPEVAKKAANKLSQHADTAQETTIKKSAQKIASAGSIREMRDEFLTLSQEINTLIRQKDLSEETQIAKYHCPMANKNSGAYWFQRTDGIKNPYYGASMLRCGSRVKID